MAAVAVHYGSCCMSCVSAIYLGALKKRQMKLSCGPYKIEKEICQGVTIKMIRRSTPDLFAFYYVQIWLIVIIYGWGKMEKKHQS